ncbi:MAG TPA: PEP-CTERM sorting domain-containing protein [Pseudomonadales bacterium]|nr:PEP-CTERM sorting domain-containing protein [Pseudomonadales bacterium]
MKNSILNSTSCALLLTLAGACAAQAQTKADLTDFYTPSYRGQAGTASALWDDTSPNSNSAFSVPYGGPNTANYVAPGGVSLANASVTQTTQGAFIIPDNIDPSGSGDIYSFSSANTFVLNYTGAFALGNVLFQTETTGSELDHSSVQLSYTLAGGGLGTLSATPVTLYYDTGSFGGFPNTEVVTAWSWNLPTDQDITSFSINFNAAGPSDALERTMLDVADFNAQPVPEPGSLALCGLGGLGLLLRNRFRRLSS